MWQKLKELKFERATIALYRSNSAMRSWKVETQLRNGDTEYKTFYEEKDAYRYYYNAARIEIDHDIYQWAEEVRV